MTAETEPLFLCPQCGLRLPVRPPCACGFVLRESHGVIQLMTDRDVAALEPFLQTYDRVRADEQWGGDDLDLPFRAKRHHDIWTIRQRTFREFETAIAKVPRGLALDIGAGNCWMTRYLDRWGFDAIALDINTSETDGLRAGQKFIDDGAVFLRVRAPMERLPFASGRIRLLTTNASFHYAADFRAALSEFERVLTPDGIIAIVDTPFYVDAADGERMLAQRVEEFRKKYGMPESMARQSRYMTYNELEELAASLALDVHIRRVWPGLARKYKELRGKLARHRIAEFPLVLLEKKSGRTGL
jgi:ubiquinone/menaquinone biosynthesis C-methylase UbiE